MESLSDLKAILHSKRANIYFLEKCRVMQKDGRVLYLTENSTQKQYWNIPIANTTCILLGTGTSITQAAVRMFASAGVMIGFCGSGGTPLISANEIEWLSPQNEYRPTEYVQNWLKFWFDEKKRLTIAKAFQVKRVEYLLSTWTKDKHLKMEGFLPESPVTQQAVSQFQARIESSKNISELLLAEAQFTKQLYQFAAQNTGIVFRRDVEASDAANAFLNHGNYLAYGLAATG